MHMTVSLLAESMLLCTPVAAVAAIRHARDRLTVGRVCVALHASRLRHRLRSLVVLTERDDNAEAQKFAIMALPNLAANESNHDHMIVRGVPSKSTENSATDIRIKSTTVRRHHIGACSESPACALASVC